MRMTLTIQALVAVIGLSVVVQGPVVAQDWGSRAKAHARPNDAASFKAWIAVLKSDRDPAMARRVTGSLGEPVTSGNKNRSTGTFTVALGDSSIDVEVILETEMSKGTVCASASWGASSAARPVAMVFGCAADPGSFGLGIPGSFTQTFAQMWLGPNTNIFVNSTPFGSPWDAANRMVQSAGYNSAVRSYIGEAILYTAEYLYTSGSGIPLPIIETVAWTGYIGSYTWPAF